MTTLRNTKPGKAVSGMGPCVVEALLCIVFHSSMDDARPTLFNVSLKHPALKLPRQATPSGLWILPFGFGSALFSLRRPKVDVGRFPNRDEMEIKGLKDGGIDGGSLGKFKRFNPTRWRLGELSGLDCDYSGLEMPINPGQ